MNFFYSQILSDNIFELTDEESHHCLNVLRKKIGDKIIILDGNGGEYSCEIIHKDKKKVKAKIIKLKISEKKPFFIHLAIAPTKSQDRLESFVEKSIEIGVDEISFIKTKRTERSRINIKRITKIAISAMKQSKQFHLPKINNIISFNKFINDIKQNQLFIAHLNDSETEYLGKLYNQNDSCCILIGPEGDFTVDEVKETNILGFVSVSLGSSILRTETAGIHAVSIINTINESKS